MSIKYPIYTEQNDLDLNLDCDLDGYLDCDLEDASVYTGHSLFDKTKSITLLFTAQSLLHRNPTNIWINSNHPDRDPV